MPGMSARARSPRGHGLTGEGPRAQGSGCYAPGGRGGLVYDVHLTRAADWADSARYPIRVDDLRALTEAENLRIIPTGVMNDHDVYAMFGLRAEPLGVWTGGEIMLREPCPWHLARAAQLAQRLRAYVIGTDEMRYRISGGELRRSGVGVDESLGQVAALLAGGPDTRWPAAPWSEAADPPRRSRWRRLFRRG